MERKHIRLIIIFSVLFALLIGIQIYFLNNSYQLKRQEVLGNVRSILSRLEDDVDIFDEKVLDDDRLLDLFVQVEDGKLTEAELQQKYKQKAEQINPIVDSYLDSLFSPLGYRVGVLKEIVAIRSKTSGESLIHQPMTVYQSDLPVSKKYTLSSGKWETSQSGTKTTEEDDLDPLEESYIHSYFVNRKSYLEIENLTWIVYKDLAGLMVSSILILLAVLFLFYLTYKNLLRQWKQVHVLHDMMDNISHELRTPIATLKFAAKSLEKSSEPMVVQVIERQVSRLESIVRPLGNLSAPYTEFAPWTSQEVDVFLADFRLANPQVALHVENTCFTQINVDRKDMTNLLDNLLSNSVKYGARNIEVSLKEVGNILRLQVKDDGVGMARNEHPYIFEKYYRIQTDNIHETKGLGLGLYIVKKTVDRYKGRIAVWSEPHQGTTFSISLPYYGL